MNRFIAWLQGSFSPRMNTVNRNSWVSSVRDSILQVLPFIFLGSVFAMLAILNDRISWWPDFWTPYGWTIGMIALFMSFLIPFNLMEKLRLRQQRLIAGLSGLVLFLIIITPQLVKAGEPGLAHPAFGPGGMFVAIVSGLCVGVVMRLLGRFSFFSETSAIPDFVRGWFDSMLPIAVVVVGGWLLIDVAGFDLYTFVRRIFQPLANVIESPWGFSLLMFLICFLYSMGISVWVVTPIVQPVMLAAITENMTEQADNLVTWATVFSAYLWIGGTGATLSLVLLMIRSRSTRLRALGKASAAPAVFNINEPVVFGAVAWNPTLMVPMWLQGLILPLIVWLFTKTIAFAPIPMRQYDLWYTPFPLSTWITTGSVRGLLLFLIIFAVSAVIWYPFFKAYEFTLVKAEAHDHVTASTAPATPATTATQSVQGEGQQ